MKIFYLIALSVIALYSCQNSGSGLYMESSKTIEIDQLSSDDSIIFRAAHVVPSEAQYQFKRDEFICFIHFGINSFTRVEWGSGVEDPSVFALKNLDTDQWCRAAKSAGMAKVIFTVKHHDGFCLWQTRYTAHGVSSTEFRDGNGDILKDLAASCKKYDLKLGVYLSPADLFQIESPDGLYGNRSKKSERTIPREVEGRPFSDKRTFSFCIDDYNEYFLNQLYELLTEYGPVHEVWFDGAHPKRKGGQTYDYIAWKELIRTLAPEAVIFGKDDVRWCGNEGGGTRDSEWDVVSFKDDPNSQNMFPDMHGDLGSVDKLREGNFLHYLPAETNTSIRAGWFYRDDTEQDVRGADDLFDIYERSVGGNSTFLLNLPPNREGEISQREVAVLKEIGDRIRSTYSNDLFKGAKGSKLVLDSNDETFELVKEGDMIEIETPEPITINRLLLQEAIRTHSMRVAEHKLEAFIEGEWKEIATSTVIGYKRILRFSDITSDRFRVTFTKTRLEPAISKISAHFYERKPAQLDISRDFDGVIAISKIQHKFGWKREGGEAARELAPGTVIHYTLDGSEVIESSPIYDKPFRSEGGTVRAKAYANGVAGGETKSVFGLLKGDWTLQKASSTANEIHNAEFAFDGDENTYWKSKNSGHPQYLEIDLNRTVTIKGFAYTPWAKKGSASDLNVEGMVERGVIKVSSDGKNWRVAGEFEFGNLINDPTVRYSYFEKEVEARYVRFESTKGARDSRSATVAELDLIAY